MNINILHHNAILQSKKTEGNIFALCFQKKYKEGALLLSFALFYPILSFGNDCIHTCK